MRLFNGPCIWLTNGLFPHFVSVLFFGLPRNEGIMVNTGIIKTLLVACALVAALAPGAVQGLDEIKCHSDGDLRVDGDGDCLFSSIVAQTDQCRDCNSMRRGAV